MDQLSATSQQGINAKDYVAKGTGFHLGVGWFVLLVIAPILLVGAVIASWGIVLVVWLLWAAFSVTRAARARAQLKGAAVRVGAEQFPEIYQVAQTMAKRLNLKECPEIYIVEDNTQNASAVKHGSKQSILLIDDIVFGALATGNVGVLHFIIGHELAHHALGHTNYLRRLISTKNLALSRLDEYSCDAIGHALVGDSSSARDAMALLLIGPQLFNQVNRQALDQQAQEVMADRHTKKVEKLMSHPLLLSRYGRLG